VGKISGRKPVQARGGRWTFSINPKQGREFFGSWSVSEYFPVVPFGKCRRSSIYRGDGAFSNLSTLPLDSVSPQSGEDLLDAVPVGLGVPVGHCIHDQHHMVAMVVGAASGCFHADAGRDACQKDLGHALPAQMLVQGCADERARALLAQEKVVRMPFQFRNQFGPIVRQRNRGSRGIGAAPAPGLSR
jgi:hypothetical protein